VVRPPDAADEPHCDLHVFGIDSPSWCGTRSSVTGWGQPGDRDHYAAKRRAAAETNAGAEYVMQDNARKQHVIQEIYHWALVAAGRLEE